MLVCRLRAMLIADVAPVRAMTLKRFLVRTSSVNARMMPLKDATGLTALGPGGQSYALVPLKNFRVCSHFWGPLGADLTCVQPWSPVIHIVGWSVCLNAAVAHCCRGRWSAQAETQFCVEMLL